MKFTLLSFLFVCAPLAGQQVFLDENFTSGVFPPPGWEEFQNGTTIGWEQEGGVGAFHDDFYGVSESSLLTAPMNLTSALDVQLHLSYGQRYATYRELNRILVTVDGGLTFNPLHSMFGFVSGGGQSLNLDLSLLAGAPSAELAFFYAGNYANEWWLERVLVDDQVAPPSNYWPDLPSTYMSVRLLDLDFDTLAGTVPTWMTLNNLDEQTRLPDAEAWCNIGNIAPPTEAFSGLYSLEMGLAPNLTGPHPVSNAMILALDGTGFTGMNLKFQAKQFLEEWNPDDGIFLSEDGDLWHPVANSWNELTAGSPDWSAVEIDLAQTKVNVNGKFFLAISQSDNYPFGANDGVIVDDVSVATTESTFHYSVSNLIAGQMVSLDVEGAIRHLSLVSIFFSLAGPGPESTLFGDAMMSLPWVDVGTFTPNANGKIHLTRSVPAGAIGTNIWSQALEISGVDGQWSNPLALTVQ